MSVGPRFDAQKAIEAILYLVGRVTDPTFHRISKLLYFADKFRLANYGALMCGDHYIAMKHGPVPSGAYDLLKAAKFATPTDLSDLTNDAIHIVDAFCVQALRPANLRKLSKADVASLDFAIAEYGKLSFGKLTDLSHDSAWNSADENDCISLEEIARATPKSTMLVDYLRNGLADRE